MEIERDIAYLDEDDKQFILEMIDDEIFTSIVEPISLRRFAGIWYERGFQDGAEQ